jgi:hemerythrin superfamily protein
MSFLDRIAATILPAASEEDRAEARQRIDRIATDEPWIAAIVDQHRRIEACFNEARMATGSQAANRAVEQLAALLTGHANAEEAVLYPEVADSSSKTQAGMGFEEHAATKVQLAKLKKLVPSSDEWREKLNHIESAVQQHVYQEENSWLPDLVEQLSEGRKATLAKDFGREFSRYMDGDSDQERNSARPVPTMGSSV